MRGGYTCRTLQELRAPLFAIVSLSEALADRLDESKEAEKARLIARSSEQLIHRLDLIVEKALKEATDQDDPEQTPGKKHRAE